MPSKPDFKPMRVLIYKRTHKGDPDDTGIFGIEDCMGKVRDWNFDAVIGIGGKSPWKKDSDIKQKINWIGIRPKRIKSNGRAKCVAFAQFSLLEEKGQDIETTYPNLFRYMFERRKRFDMAKTLPVKVHEDVQEVLKLVESKGPSNEYGVSEIKFIWEQNSKDKTQCNCGKGNKIRRTVIINHSNC